MDDKFDALVAKLKEIFQIDKPELDFGVYRILNARRREIEDFLDNRFKAKVEAALGGAAADGAAAALAAARDKVVATLGPAAIGEDGAIASAFAATPAGVEYENARADAAAASAGADAESAVYAHLLAFFSRYYEEGDFISQRRYKDGVYAIPYSGEEVKLHWANADQYYTKSGENFTNYDFPLPSGLRVRFVLVSADTAKDNVKDNDAERRFVLWNPEKAQEPDVPTFDDEDDEVLPERPKLPADFIEEKNGELFIYFQYLKFPKKTKQKDLLDEAATTIVNAIATREDLREKWSGLLAPAPTASDRARTLLRKHLDDYAAKNTSDYFIHKDLGSFLRRELDFYVKNEMMHLDEVDAADFDRGLAPRLRTIRAFRAVAKDLIAFMAQLEDFQKKLWLKRKFVVQSDWCFTLDIVAKHATELMDAIFANEAQKAEWRRLGLSDEKIIDARMVDTKFFPPEFKAKLLAAIPDLDACRDGLFVRSENFQALRLLQERYREQVKCIYIDPPYNTDASEIIYKNGYKNSSWLSLIEDGLQTAKGILQDKGGMCVTIDDFEDDYLKLLCDHIFGSENRLGTACIRSNPQGRSTVKGFSITHEYGLFYGNTDQFPGMGRLSHDEEQLSRYNETDEAGRRFQWENFRKTGTDSNHADRVKQFYHFFVDTGSGKFRIPEQHWEEETQLWLLDETPMESEIDLLPINDLGEEKVWKWGIDRAKKEIHLIKCEISKKGDIQLYRRNYCNEKGSLPDTWWGDARYAAGSHGTNLLTNLFGKNRVFSFPKSVHAVRETLQILNLFKGEIVLDYFAGSGTTGHAVIDLNRSDNGHRKYILVEMGEHFETVLKPRIEKVVYSPDWKDGKPEVTDKGVSHCFQYLTLESYEDALNNLELKAPDGTTDLFASGGSAMRDEYLLRYMLDVEARGSLLSTDDFRHPFDYSLKIAVDSSGASAPRKIDLVETFNFLVGLKVAQCVREEEKGYAFLDGTLPSGERAFVLWRDVDKMGAAALNEFLAKRAVKPGTTEYDVIYVNGDHAIANHAIAPDGGERTLKVRQIEDEFLARMWEEK